MSRPGWYHYIYRSYLYRSIFTQVKQSRLGKLCMHDFAYCHIPYRFTAVIALLIIYSFVDHFYLSESDILLK